MFSPIHRANDKLAEAGVLKKFLAFIHVYTENKHRHILVLCLPMNDSPFGVPP